MSQRIWILCYHRKNRPKIEISVCERCRYHKTCKEFKGATEHWHRDNASHAITGQR